MPRKLLYTSIVVLLVATWFSVGAHQGDEHFQVLEFMAYQLGMVPGEVLPWEFGAQMRPSLQPWLAYSLHCFFGVFTEVNPYLFAWFTRVLSAAAFLWLGTLLYRRYAPVFDARWRWWLAAGLLLSWCNVYAGIRFASEAWSGLCFLLGFLLVPFGGAVAGARGEGREQGETPRRPALGGSPWSVRRGPGERGGDPEKGANQGTGQIRKGDESAPTDGGSGGGPRRTVEGAEVVPTDEGIGEGTRRTGDRRRQQRSSQAPPQPPGRREGVTGLLTPGRDGGAWHYLLAGLLFGISFLFRYQLAIAVVALLAWLLVVNRTPLAKLLLIILGGVMALGLGTVLDYWFYGEWVIAPWNYLAENLLEGKAAEFGSRPWWGYLELIFERGVPPLSLVYLAATGWLVYRYRRDPVAWVTIAFIVVHSVLARKDIRFLFPLLPFLPVAIVAGARDLTWWRGEGFWRKGWVRGITYLLLIMNGAILIAVALRPMNSRTLASRYLYHQYDEPVTLLADGKHIYQHSNLTVRYYQPAGMQLINRPRAEWPADCPTRVCLYSEQTREPNPPAGARLVYTNRPTGLDGLGVSGLLDTQKWWYLYELR